MSETSPAENSKDKRQEGSSDQEDKSGGQRQLKWRVLNIFIGAVLGTVVASAICLTVCDGLDPAHLAMGAGLGGLGGLVPYLKKPS